MISRVAKWVSVGHVIMAVAFSASILGFATNSANAAVINILNPGFEVDSAADGAFGPLPSNWDDNADWGAGYGDPLGVGSSWGITSPDQAGDVNNMGYMNPDGRLFQNLVYADMSPVLIAPGQLFTITADFGRRLDSTVGDSPVEVNIIETSTNSVVATVTYQVASQALGTITTQTFTLNTGASPLGIGSQVKLEFHLRAYDIPGQSPDQALIDNIAAAVVPEPVTFVILLAGGLLSVRRCRKN